MSITAEQRIRTNIQASYTRLNSHGTVYLVRNYFDDYGGSELPDPEKVHAIYVAMLMGVDRDGLLHGANIVDLPNPNYRPPPEEVNPRAIYQVSPRELFTRPELLDVVRKRTRIPPPSPKKLHERIHSVEGKFRETVAPEMARVVLERFQYDPRTPQGRLVEKR